MQDATSEEREYLESILEERDKGPFIPVPDDLVERVMKQVMGRVRGARDPAAFAKEHHRQ